MAFLDKITTVAGKAVDKGNDVIEITKLKSKILTFFRLMSSPYLKQREACETIDAGIAPGMAQIDEKLEEIKALNKQIEDIKG